jgi:hypothetical protein
MNNIRSRRTRRFPWPAFLLVTLLLPAGNSLAEEPAWRNLPLIEDGKVASAWKHLGWGGFTVHEGTLRSESAPEGMGLLVYQKEKFGNCQIRVVYRSEDARDNAGVFIRIDDGILTQKNPPAVKRQKDGSLSDAELNKLKKASAKEQGPWYAVHHGYEVQIQDAGDPYHRTGAIYSLAPAAASPRKRPEQWKTMIITLRGNKILVSIDGKQVTTFEPHPGGKDPRKKPQWYEPAWGNPRPLRGYIGLQNHDPGDVVDFKEISVRPLPE